ncbi:hypothetical protein BBP40_011503 [Aspergillus hancockii]|nr:hypothetical protein BBP40_011503 [Aspergillus hancockii]
METIIAGATGFIGSHILSECLASPDISSIIILTRRSLVDENNLRGNPKATEIIHDDFSQYPSDLVDQLKGTKAAIGDRPVQFPGLNTAKRVGIDYTVVDAQAINRFRFLYCSGWGIEEDQSKNSWIEPEARKIKIGDLGTGYILLSHCGQGLVEKWLSEIARSTPGLSSTAYDPAE